jgi:hypothetical protein
VCTGQKDAKSNGFVVREFKYDLPTLNAPPHSIIATKVGLVSPELITYTISLDADNFNILHIARTIADWPIFDTTTDIDCLAMLRQVKDMGENNAASWEERVAHSVECTFGAGLALSWLNLHTVNALAFFYEHIYQKSRDVKKEETRGWKTVTETVWQSLDYDTGTLATATNDNVGD